MRIIGGTGKFKFPKQYKNVEKGKLETKEINQTRNFEEYEERRRQKNIDDNLSY